MTCFILSATQKPGLTAERPLSASGYFRYRPEAADHLTLLASSSLR